VPGFDFSGEIIWTGKGKDAKEYTVGQKVFGFSLFGAYSQKVLVRIYGLCFEGYLSVLLLSYSIFSVAF